MTDYVFNLMRCFPGSMVIPCGDVVIGGGRGPSFSVKGVEEDLYIIYKLLEWCSRDAAKGMPYSSPKRNNEFRATLVDGFNKFLHTDFTSDDMEIIYSRLGNGINHDLTIKFVDSGYNMNVLYEVNA